MQKMITVTKMTAHNGHFMIGLTYTLLDDGPKPHLDLHVIW